ncbi:hypothetical protein ACN28S_18635 [Cystobacter fuscus]
MSTEVHRRPAEAGPDDEVARHGERLALLLPHAAHPVHFHGVEALQSGEPLGLEDFHEPLGDKQFVPHTIDEVPEFFPV